jgi:CRP-like cAMP-binding protein
VRVLEADPELGLRVPPAHIAAARQSLLATVRYFEPGTWEVPGGDGTHGHLGFLIVDGLLARDLVLARHVSTELLGEGDVLQPWLPTRGDGLVRYRVYWHALTPVTVAVLDDRFAKALVEWPQVTAALLERAIRRTLGMSIHQALLQLSPAENRLLVLFWYLAERWGRVTAAGIVLPLGLTHQVLGQLIGCQRASVTTALKQIESSGLARRRTDGTWLLTGSPPDELSSLSWTRERAGRSHTDRSHGKRAAA